MCSRYEGVPETGVAKVTAGVAKSSRALPALQLVLQDPLEQLAASLHPFHNLFLARDGSRRSRSTISCIDNVLDLSVTVREGTAA